MQQTADHKKWLLIPVLLGLVLCSVGAVTFGEAPKSLDEIQGNWKLVLRDFNGQPLPFIRGGVEIKGNRYVIRNTVKLEARKIKIDTTRVPATLDQIRNEGAKNEQTLEYVFEVSDTKLVLCSFLIPNGNRPTSLEYIPGKKLLRSEYHRRSPAPSQGTSVMDQLEGEWVKMRTQADFSTSNSDLDNTVLVIHEGMTGGEAEYVDERTLTLHEGSNHVDFFRTSLNQTFRAIMDYDPKAEELKVCAVFPSVDAYPTEFVSKQSDHSSLEVFKREKPKAP